LILSKGREKQQNIGAGVLWLAHLLELLLELV
jgi:hypothetical protein